VLSDRLSQVLFFALGLHCRFDYLRCLVLLSVDSGDADIFLVWLRLRVRVRRRGIQNLFSSLEGGLAILFLLFLLNHGGHNHILVSDKQSVAVLDASC